MRFFAELKRRHVVQVGIAYLVIAWGIAQVAELVLDTFETPPWLMQLVLVILACGLPVALVLSWLYTLRAGKLQREASQPQAVEASAEQNDAAAMVVTENESIAVLPFVNMSSDPEQEYFSDGIAEELLNLLAKIPELRVAARTSAFSFKGKDVDIPEIAQRLKVAHVLEGSVRKSGHRIRITAQLIKADNGYHLWSETWDRTLEDIFAVQDEIAAEVAQQLRLTLLKTPPTTEETNPEAYALYLQARHLTRLKSAAGYQQALALLEQALGIAPDYAPAWAERANVLNKQVAYGLIPCDDGCALSQEAAMQALALDPDCPQAHAELGYAAAIDRDFAVTAHHLRAALAGEPTDPEILGYAALIAQCMGRFDTARTLYEYVIARDPANPATRNNLGYMLYSLGDLDLAIEQWRTALQLSPGQNCTWASIAVAQLQQGNISAALESGEKENDEAYRNGARALIYFAMGEQEKSDAALAGLIESSERETAYNIAFIFSYRGEMDRAFEWLDKALHYKDSGLPQINIEPLAKNLRNDPRWDAFINKAGIAQQQLDAIEFDIRPPA